MPNPAPRPGWKRVKFGEMAEQIAERVEPTPADGKTYVGLEHLESGSLTVRRWGAEVALIGTKLRMRKGDILFAKRNAYLRRVAIAPHDGLFSAHGMVLRARPEAVLPDFLPFFMQSDLFMDRAEQISVGSLSPTINWGTLKDQEFTLPPLEEQRRLCRALQQWQRCADQLRSAASAAFQIRDALRVRLFELTRETVPLEQCISFLTSGSRGWSRFYADDGDIFLRVGNLNSATVQLNMSSVQRVAAPNDMEAERTEVREGDVLLGITGEAGLGLVALTRDLDGRAFISQHIAMIRPRAERFDGRFIAHALAGPHGQRQIAVYNQPGAKSGMTLIDVRRLRVPNLPLPEQQAQADLLDIVERSICLIEQRRVAASFGSKAQLDAAF